MKKSEHKNKRLAVFIDGSNLYFKLRSLVPRKMDFLHYRYKDLFSSLEPTAKLTYIGYYIGAVKTKKKQKSNEKSEPLRQNQQKLFHQLRKQNIEVVLGYLLETDGKFHEKGVDVRLALDIALGAVEDTYDVALVVSSDTDLLPAIEKATSVGKEVVYVGFGHQPSFALLKHATRTSFLAESQVVKFEAKSLKIKRFDDITPPKKSAPKRSR
jgi:uncharacterized LabA/DUF88 family protein